MKLNLIIALILLIPSIGLAQNEKYKDTVYFDSKWKECSKEASTYYRTFSESSIKYKDKYLIQITDHYKTGEIQMVGYLQSFDSKDKIGLYSYYKKNGKTKFKVLHNINNTIELFKSMKVYLNEVKKCDSANVDLYVTFFF